MLVNDISAIVFKSPIFLKDAFRVVTCALTHISGGIARASPLGLDSTVVVPKADITDKIHVINLICYVKKAWQHTRKKRLDKQETALSAKWSFGLKIVVNCNWFWASDLVFNNLNAKS